VLVVDRDSPPPRYSGPSTIVASTALILTNAKPCAGRILSVSAAVLSGCNDLKTAFGRTLDATTRHGIALVFTEVKRLPLPCGMTNFLNTVMDTDVDIPARSAA
jgi:hypothetical protein